MMIKLNFWGETAQSMNRKPVFVPEVFYGRQIHSQEWMKLSEGDFNERMSVVSRHGVDLKPLPTLIGSLLLRAKFVFANCTLTDTSRQQ